MELYSERLKLRDWCLSDQRDLVEGLNDLSVSQWLAFVVHPYTDEDAKKWIEFCLTHSREKGQ